MKGVAQCLVHTKHSISISCHPFYDTFLILENGNTSKSCQHGLAESGDSVGNRRNDDSTKK